MLQNLGRGVELRFEPHGAGASRIFRVFELNMINRFVAELDLGLGNFAAQHQTAFFSIFHKLVHFLDGFEIDEFRVRQRNASFAMDRANVGRSESVGNQLLNERSHVNFSLLIMNHNARDNRGLFLLLETADWKDEGLVSRRRREHVVFGWLRLDGSKAINDIASPEGGGLFFDVADVANGLVKLEEIVRGDLVSRGHG